MRGKTRKYVIHEHRHQDHQTHWDLMLETSNSLTTFRLPQPPAELPCRFVVEKIQDHQRRFLTYQGPVNQGKGSVKFADRGTYETVEKTTAAWTLKLTGRVLNCEVRLEQTAGQLICTLKRTLSEGQC